LTSQPTRGELAAQSGARIAASDVGRVWPGNDEIFRALFEQSAIGVAVVELDGRPVLANAALQQFLGYSAAELSTLTYHAFTYPDDLALDAEHASKLVAGAIDHYVVDKRYVRKDSRVVWGRLTVSLLRASDGAPQFVLAMVEDSTERRLAEEALLSSEARYRRVVEMAYEGVWTIDRHALTDYVNPRMASMLGYAAEEMLGRSMFAFMDDDARGEAASNFERRQEGVAELHEFRLRRKDGAELWTLMSTNPILDANGEFVGALAMVTDITERKRAEDALRESETRYRLATRATDDMVYDWDVRAGTLYWTEAIKTVLGHEPDDPATAVRWWVEQLHPDDRDATLDSLSFALASTDDTWRAEYRMRRGDGRYAQVLERAHIVRDSSATPTRMIGAIADQSRRHELEAQLRQSQKMEAVGRLAGGVAHDFNNLLMIIQNYTKLVADELPTGAASRTDLEEVLQAAERAGELTRQLLALGRKQVLRPEQLDINHAVASTAAILRRVIGEDIAIETALDPGVWPVYVDHGQFEQVLMNLAVNARDAMPSGGAIRLRTSNVVRSGHASDATRPTNDVGSYVSLIVEDTGTGIDPAILPEIFEPFFTTKAVGEGTGLGLSTVYGIVEQSGGSISVESTPGRGTSFSILLPRADTAAHVHVASAPIRGAADGTETILLVEDDERVRTLVRRVLEKHDYIVHEATSGPDALRIMETTTQAKNGRIDLLLTDVVMPGQNGRELADDLTARWPELRVLYMSGYANDEMLRRGVAGLGSAFLQKPFTSAALSQAVRTLLDG
jgi:two-component system, cell cycle sensor histidine kinase and response regulator CckA